MENYLTVNDCEALGVEIEKITSAFKSLMLSREHAGEEPAPELIAAFEECVDWCRDFVDLYDYYYNKPTPEEEAADWEANYHIATGKPLNNDIMY